MKRLLLAASLLTISAGGCTLPGGQQTPLAKVDTESPAESTVKTVAWNALLSETSDQLESAQIQPTDGGTIDLASPINDSFLAGAEAQNDGAVTNAEGIEPLGQDLVPEVVPGIVPDVLVPPVGLPVPTISVAETQEPVNYFVSIALSSHPRILAARHRVAAAVNVIPQARALPDPQFNNTFWPVQTQALQTAAGRVGNQMSLSQSVPWPKKLSTRAAVAAREVQVAQAEVDRTEREITESVRLAYYEVWFATRALAIIDETRDLLDDLTRVAEARYRAGGTQQDVLRAQLETDRLDDQTVILTKQKEVAQADLATLVQQPVSLLPEATEELGLDDVSRQIDDLIASAEQCNPELRGLFWEIQRDREKQRLAYLERYPDLKFGVNWGLVSDGSNVLSKNANGHDLFSFNVGTTLPIWKSKINAGVREAAQRANSTTRLLDSERDEIYGKLRRLLSQSDSLVEQADIFQHRIIPRTEDTLKLAIADYRGKRTNFFSLIETYRELLTFETQLARINASLAGTVAQLDRTVGCPVELGTVR